MLFQGHVGQGDRVRGTMSVNAANTPFSSVSSPVVDSYHKEIHLGLRLPQATVTGAVSVEMAHVPSRSDGKDSSGRGENLPGIGLASTAPVSQSVELLKSANLPVDVSEEQLLRKRGKTNIGL
jgi:hypothetical protein